ncbi:MAG TPA: hypothetical protein PLU50_02560 [Pseudobdellovibrionaceae bacterium]|nr:hypothetical protein [Pseudobdellovibrionaceae bacterium]
MQASPSFISILTFNWSWHSSPVSIRFAHSMEQNQTCPHFPSCSGCDHWGLQPEAELQRKIDDLQNLVQGLYPQGLVQNLEFRSLPLRDRVDFRLQNGKLGLLERDTKALIDLPECPVLSPALNQFLTRVRTLVPQLCQHLRIATLRLRVGPQQSSEKIQQGLWIDAANADIRKLLDDRELVQKLTEICVLEIGQRKKTPYWDSVRERYGLRESEPKQFWAGLFNKHYVSLYSAVGGFTQPSMVSSCALNLAISEMLQTIQPEVSYEWGAGIGAMSLPFWEHSRTHVCLEKEAELNDAFRMNLASLGVTNTILQEGDFSRASFAEVRSQIDFEVKIPGLKNKTCDVLFLNPPRSGTGKFLQGLTNETRPKHLIYLSCNPESMIRDLTEIAPHYELQKALLVNQFPHSRHSEALIWLQRKNH